MVDLTDPSPLIMTNFERIATVAAFAAIVVLALWERFGPGRAKK